MSATEPRTLIVPGRPLLLNKERGLHRQVAARQIREIRRSAWLLAKAEKWPRFEAITVTVRPHVRDRRPQDVAACYPSAKASIDGLVDAGVLDDDGPDRVRALTFLPVCLRSDLGDALEVIATPIVGPVRPVAEFDCPDCTFRVAGRDVVAVLDLLAQHRVDSCRGPIR